jgi:hypothetical protein
MADAAPAENTTGYCPSTLPAQRVSGGLLLWQMQRRQRTPPVIAPPFPAFSVPCACPEGFCLPWQVQSRHGAPPVALLFFLSRLCLEGFCYCRCRAGTEHRLLPFCSSLPACARRALTMWQVQSRHRTPAVTLLFRDCLEGFYYGRCSAGIEHGLFPFCSMRVPRGQMQSRHKTPVISFLCTQRVDAAPA